MNLESQVCSLELSKRLDELGVKKESYFYWIEFKNYSSPIEQINKLRNEIINFVELQDYRERDYLKDFKEYAAFTVGELGEMLPKYIIKEGYEYYYNQIPSKHCDSWIIFYRDSFHSWDGEDMEDKNEANARAKMLIYLIENGLIKNETDTNKN